jgi:hypothetical protein
MVKDYHKMGKKNSMNQLCGLGFILVISRNIGIVHAIGKSGMKSKTNLLYMPK